MPDYTVFGNCLRTEIPFPELRAIEDAAPRWRLRVSRRRRPMHGAELLGTDELGDGKEVRLYKFADGFRLEYDDDTGAFDVSRDGRDLLWYSVSNAAEEMVRLHVLGRVLATALHAAGVFSLHGSGVLLDGGAIGLLAPRFRGKSTLAMALTQAGGRLLSDDTLAVDPDASPPKVWPGVHSVRLWGDSAERIMGDQLEGNSPFAVKRTFAELPDCQLARGPAHLSAIYLMTPTQGSRGTPAARRTLLAPVSAAVSLVGHAKIGSLLGRSEAPVLFDRAVRVARAARVYRLELARDFDRISEVVAHLGAWHRTAA